MEQSDALRIKMLGEFTIKNSYYSYPSEAKKSKQISFLLEYLIANKGSEISKDKLISVLWPNDESDNPNSALRNLIYRARIEMERFFPQGGVECIISRNNSYLWNRDIECTMDIEDFDEAYKQSQTTEDTLSKIEAYKRMIELYTGEFLPESTANEWVVFRSMYYSRLYIKAVLEVCDYLTSQGEHSAVIELCERASLIEQMDERIHEKKIEAYVANDQAQMAIEYYYYIIDLFCSRLGIDVSSTMRDLYNRIINMLPDYQVDMSNLESSLRENDTKGAFYCSYDSFKNIYRVNARMVRRTKATRFLVLLTAVDKEMPGNVGERTKIVMSNLKRIIIEHLRKNDIFTQFSATQYSIIIAAHNEQDCEKAVNRIKEKFALKNPFKNVELETEIKQIS